MITIYKERLMYAILLFLGIFFILLDLVLNWGMGISVLGYTDEIIGLLFGFYCVFLYANNLLEKGDKAIIRLLFLCIILGLTSNIFSGLINKKVPILLDAFWLCKMFTCYIGTKNLMTKKSAETVLELMLPIAKFVLVVGAICGFINIWYNLGMDTGEVRYGLRSFNFIFGNPGRYGIICGCCLVVIIYKCDGILARVIYSILAMWNIFLTTKGTAYIFIMCYLLLLFLWVRNKKINFIQILIIVVLGCILSSYQIKTYILDKDTARSVLLFYGFVTANRYFPLGSGFATYGSDLAAKYYSKLYVQYGFDNVYGLSRTFGGFLNDVYLGGIVGELGYIGLIMFLAILVIIFVQVNNIHLDKSVKAATMSLYVTILVSGIATGIFKSSIGILVFILLGIMTVLGKENEELEEYEDAVNDNNANLASINNGRL